ncbi:sodium/hydrogen exchanger [Staphylothermus marinus F1]|uniref:Sodium/hydrogen exchanger n=1 Tax=Staphylothermus marinus (strain ATCC 43588 / DSM 3639 / JCM 9404 / F1) TaxID=399550 RepID=A3DL54_STAMF|nr:cation:proton antiporter [Staphylothermus marinus]ABN69364.1 sodium/hydrogen exchanger [Staphylothermus marinus F1]
MDVEYLIFEIVMLLMLAKILEIPFRKYSLHPMAGHVITGIVLGPYFLGLVKPSGEMLGIAYFGLLLLMFYTGLTTDYRELKRRSKTVLLMGGMGVLVTFTLIYLAMCLLGYEGLPGIFIAASLSNTATETMAAIVAKKGDTISRSLLVGASFVDDVMAVFIIGILAGLAVENSLSITTLVILTSKALFFLSLIFFISSLLVNKYPKIYKTISQDYFWFATFSILLSLSLAVAAKLFGLSELIGAYLAGILISRGREFHDPMLRTRIAITEFISDFTVVLDALFIPLFFAYIGLSYSPGAVSFSLYLVLLSLAILGKFVGTAPIAYISLKDKRRSIAVGLAMSGRGALETALLKLGLDYGIISPMLFNTAITVSLTTTVIAPILYSIVYKK